MAERRQAWRRLIRRRYRAVRLVEEMNLRNEQAAAAVRISCRDLGSA